MVLSALSASSALSGFGFAFLRVFLRALRPSASSTSLPLPASIRARNENPSMPIDMVLSALSASSALSGFGFAFLRVFLRVLRPSAVSQGSLPLPASIRAPASQILADIAKTLRCHRHGSLCALRFLGALRLWLCFSPRLPPRAPRLRGESGIAPPGSPSPHPSAPRRVKFLPILPKPFDAIDMVLSALSASSALSGFGFGFLRVFLRVLRASAVSQGSLPRLPSLPLPNPSAPET